MKEYNTAEPLKPAKYKYTAVIVPMCNMYKDIMVDLLVIPEAGSNMAGRSFNIVDRDVRNCCDEILAKLSCYPLSEIIVSDIGIGLAFLDYLTSRTNGFVTVRGITNIPRCTEERFFG